MNSETTDQLIPKWDANGLITAVVQNRVTGDVLMLAHMNAQALEKTVESGAAHFWSRSRKALWKKGEISGNVMRIAEIRIDCDQDAIVLICDPAGPACHTGETSCFYRRVNGNKLEKIT